MSGLSIITAVHNSLPMNRLYWTALNRNTLVPFELIVVDNHSTDGSEAFFRGLSEKNLGPGREVVYVRNEKNQSYPTSQIQGMTRARYDVLCFLNNDVWMPKGWHAPFEKALRENEWLVLSPSGQEAQPTQQLSLKLKRRWREVTWLSRAWRLALMRTEEERLWKSLEWMYGNLSDFHSPTPQVTPGYFHGIKGDSVVIHRRLLERVPCLWDERVEASDWHLYLTMAKLNEEDPTVPLPRVLLDAYIHHFGRYSAHQKYEPIERRVKVMSVEDAWGAATVKRLWWGENLPQT